MCSLNSNLQLLRHIPEFCNELNNWKMVTPLLQSLESILSQCGTTNLVSASTLRHHLASVTNKPLNSGAQYDTMELFNYLLDHCPSELFSFKTSHEYRFQINGCASPCPSCKEFPRPVSGSDKILKIALPKSPSPVSFEHIMKKHFSALVQPDGRMCTQCLEKDSNCPKLR